MATKASSSAGRLAMDVIHTFRQPSRGPCGCLPAWQGARGRASRSFSLVSVALPLCVSERGRRAVLSRAESADGRHTKLLCCSKPCSRLGGTRPPVRTSAAELAPAQVQHTRTARKAIAAAAQTPPPAHFLPAHDGTNAPGPVGVQGIASSHAAARGVARSAADARRESSARAIAVASRLLMGGAMRHCNGDLRQHARHLLHLPCIWRHRRACAGCKRRGVGG